MKAIIGKKIGMTRIFDQDGKAVAVTVIEAKPSVVTQIKTKEKDKYQAVQLGYGVKKDLSKPLKGHLAKAKAKSSYLKEFCNLAENLKVGDKISLEDFKVNDIISVCATSKGKGFAGVMKRHDFSGGPMTHGGDGQRAPGSIGCAYPQRVIKGRRMAGHMGAETVTIKGLKIIQIDKDKNLLVVKGAVPGPNRAILTIASQGK